MQPYDVKNAQKASIARYVILIVVILNAVLTILGMPVIPAEYNDIITAALVAVVGLYVGFKNNYLTKRGKAQAAALDRNDLLNK